MMDIQKTVEEVVKKIQGSEDLQKSFTSDPVSAVKGLVGKDVSEDVLGKIVKAVTEKLGSAGSGLSGIVSKVTGLFGKK